MNRFHVAWLVGQYDNPIPTLFLSPIDGSKIPAHNRWNYSQ